METFFHKKYIKWRTIQIHVEKGSVTTKLPSKL